MERELYEHGLRIRKEVLGEEYVENALNNIDDFNAEFQTYVTEVAWGRVWGQDTLSRKQRSLNNLCMLAALGMEHEFEIHFRGALNNGCTKDEIRGTLMQVAVYCGAPKAFKAFRIGSKILSGLKGDKE